MTVLSGRCRSSPGLDLRLHCQPILGRMTFQPAITSILVRANCSLGRGTRHLMQSARKRTCQNSTEFTPFADGTRAPLLCLSMIIALFLFQLNLVSRRKASPHGSRDWPVMNHLQPLQSQVISAPQDSCWRIRGAA